MFWLAFCLANCDPASAEKPHAFDPAASRAAILNDVLALRIRRAFLNSHRLFACKAAQQIDQWALVVVQVDVLRKYRSRKMIYFAFGKLPRRLTPLSIGRATELRRHNAAKLNNAWWRCTRTGNCNTPAQHIRVRLAKVA
jgi:hypothetical protein